MSARQTSGFSLRRALLVSVALHFAMAALLVVGPRSSANSSGHGSGVSSEAVRVSTITIAFRPHGAVRKAAASAPARTKTEIAKFVPSPKVGKIVKSAGSRAVAHLVSKTVVASATVARDEAGRRLDETTRVAAMEPNDFGGGAIAAPTLAPAEKKLAIPVVAASPTASAAPEMVALAQSHAAIDTQSGGWGQSAKPLVEDDDELAKVRAAAHVSGKVSIDVDDKGNATRVILPSSLSGDIRAELEREFLAMHYLPAECNGLKCVGTLQISLESN